MQHKFPNFPAQRASAQWAAGFTLIELLAVLAIMAVLIGLGAMIVKGAGNFSARSASENVLQILENARMQAMSGDTFVRVAFAPLPTNHSGHPGMGVVTLASTVGIPDAPESAWRETMKAVALPGMQFSDGTLTGSISLANNDLPSFTKRAWGTDVNFRDGVLFSPSGTAYASNTRSLDRQLSLSVRRNVGSEPPSEISLSALSGFITLASQ